MTQELIDEDDWVEIDRELPAGAERPDVEVRLSIFKMRAKTLKARTFIVLRNDAAKWIADNGPRFRIAVGGAKANFLRIVPDVHAGKFENSTFKGVERLLLGHVSAWPNEVRASTAAKWEISGARMTLELPRDFALPSSRVEISAPAPSRITAAVARGVPISFGGDPSPGRSAADQRIKR